MAYTYDPKKKSWSAKVLEKTTYNPKAYKTEYNEEPTYSYTVSVPRTTTNWVLTPVTYTTPNGPQTIYESRPVTTTEYVPENRIAIDEKKAKEAKEANRLGRIGNAANNARNKINGQINSLYDKIESIVSQLEANKYTTKNPYLTAKGEIEKIGANLKKILEEQKNLIKAAGATDAEIAKEISDDFPDQIINKYVDKAGYFRTYYATEKVTPWDTALGADTPGALLKDKNGNSLDSFDADYYLNKTASGKAADAAYDAAVNNDNLDILARYDRNSYALWSYTYVGKPAGERGSPVSASAEAAVEKTKDYKEEVPGKTDTIYTNVRDKVLGLEEDVEKNKVSENARNYYLRDLDSKIDSFVKDNSSIKEQWETAKRQLLYSQQFPNEPKGGWIQLTEALKLNPKKLSDATYFGKVLAWSLVKPDYLSDAEYKNITAQNKELINTLNQFKSQVQKISEDISVYQTDVEKTILDVTGEEEKERVSKFGEMRKEVLLEAKKKLIAAQEKESSLALMKNLSGLNELENMQTNLQNSILGDFDIGGMYSLGGKKETENPFKQFLKVDLGIDSVFGTKNGLIYNWEDWFYKEIEKKYSGGMDIPDDYVSPTYRTKARGYIDKATLDKWKKYDDAYIKLKTDPNNTEAKNLLKSLPKDYVKAEERQEVKQSWLDFEAARLAAGFVDSKTATAWEEYDKAYDIINSKTVNKNSEEYKAAVKAYNSRPSNYVAPNKRVSFEIQLAQNFFTDYLKPRFDESKSLSEFQSYLDVQKGEENIFQTEDRMTALKRAAQTTITTWFSNLQKLGASTFNSDFYKDPIGYYKKYGVRDNKQIILDSTKFQNYVSDKYTKQKNSYDQAWTAAKANKTSKDFEGKDINWNAWAYYYNLDITKESNFAYLHYLVLGRNAPKLDANGNIMKDANGNVIKDSYDPAPDVFGTEINKIFLQQVLTPFLKKKMDQIGSVFGEFVRPEEFVDSFFDNLDLSKNKEELSKLFDLYGLKETADLTELKELMIEGLSGSEGQDIRDKIDQVLQENGKPTQTQIGVDYIQRDKETGSGKAAKDTAAGLYGIFKNAGYQGTEDEFYQEFMPDATTEDIELYSMVTNPEKMKDIYKVDLSQGPEKVLGQVYSLMGEEQEDIYSMDAEEEIGTILSKMKEKARPSTASLKKESKIDFGSLFKLELPEEREETFSSKIKTGSDFLNEYKKAGSSQFSNAFA
jgi:hypothetical protein